MRRTLYAALAAAVLTACGDPAGSSASQQGLLRFNYTGPVTGSYLAETTVQDTTGTGAYALARTNPFGYEIDSRGALQTPPVLRVRIATDQRGTGVYEVQPLCDVGDARRCAHVRIEFPDDPATGARRQYLLFAGTLTITSANARRIRGTFSGTSQANATGAFQVQNGEFDLPVLSP
jgi:hypothetical protein